MVDYLLYFFKSFCDMDKTLIDILSRMQDPTEQKPNTRKQTPSWYAHRDAEKLDNVNFISQLEDYILNEKNKNHRRDGYFILGKILLNISSKRKLLIKHKNSIQFLINQLEIETDKYILSSILDRLSDIPILSDLNIKPIISNLTNKLWLIRHSAICSLTKSEHNFVEDEIIKIIKNSTDNNDITYANSVLNHIGTIKSMEYLEPLTKSRIRDIKISASFAIESIKKRNMP